MKKFSVLLIVVLFFVPVFVYGLTGSSLTKPIGLVNAMKKFAPISRMLSSGKTEVLKPLSFDPMLPDDPFFPAPNGIRGKITEINLNDRMIAVKDAVYFNEAKQVHEKADFRIYTDNTTDFYVNLIPEGKFEDLQVGDEIISKGPFNLYDHTSRNSVAIYKGKFVNPEEKRLVDFTGVVTQLDKANLKFIVPGPTDLSISLTEQSKCLLSTWKDQTESVEFLGFRVLPDWVKEGTPIRGTLIVSPDMIEYVAETIYFIKE